MCGIIAINAKSGNVVDYIISALRNLEYRGYDSAGLSALVNGKISLTKVQGKIDILAETVKADKLYSNVVIGHTRWATHGAANQVNAHPHQTANVSVVHNGIIENYADIKSELEKLGHHFLSQTDSEVIPHLITYYLKKNLGALEAVELSVSRLKGAFSIAVIFADYQDLIIAARKGSPLVIGFAENKNIIASDPYAISFMTNNICYLEENDIALVKSDVVEIYNHKQLVTREKLKLQLDQINYGKGNFRHYMLKEIYEQSSVAANIINAYVDHENNQINFPGLNINFNIIDKINIVACGTSYYAAMVAKYWLESLLSIIVEVDIASEFRYRITKQKSNILSIFLSQSGETADTLAALRYAKNNGHKTLCIVNVEQSSLAREADFSIPCLAGPEISVASTKGFVSQLTVLLLLSLYVASKSKVLSDTVLEENLMIVKEIPGRIAEFLNSTNSISDIASELSLCRSCLFIGRNYIYPLALEGALKLKELTYIHAEAIAAGELKHGTIALIDKDMYVVVLAPENNLFEKTCSNAQEIAARGGNLISISSADGNRSLTNIAKFSINISKSSELIEPIIFALPMQLLAYNVALNKGTDVDQPRNLAKSVTVE